MDSDNSSRLHTNGQGRKKRDRTVNREREVNRGRGKRTEAEGREQGEKSG